MLNSCSSTLDVPYDLVEHVSWLIHGRQQGLNSPWRRLDCFKQVLLALAHFRKNEAFPQLAAEFGVSTATAWRYVTKRWMIWRPGHRDCTNPLSDWVKTNSSSLTAPSSPATASARISRTTC
ncbi:hypothetical protein DMH25_43385 [Streptomyces sp. WAC 01325]|nr:hypothetical protein DMH25_43385 [Streptomyces sp. WAC 01325]